MKVYRLNWLEPKNIQGPDWEIIEHWECESHAEAIAFCKGLNTGYQKGRLDHMVAITEADLHKHKIKNAFVFDLQPKLEKLGIGFLMDYVNDDFTAFNIPDYKLSQAVSEIESLLPWEV